jgi:hypothetical protein
MLSKFKRYKIQDARYKIFRTAFIVWNPAQTIPHKDIIVRNAGQDASCSWQLALAVVVAITTMPIQAQVSLESKVDKSELTIGDRITYSVIISRDEKTEIKMPGLAVNLGAFEIKDYKVVPPSKKDNKITEQFDYVVSVYDTGKYIIPPIGIMYSVQADTGKVWRELQTEPITLFVKSMFKGEKPADIKDVKPPLELHFDYRKLLYIGIILFLVILIGVLVYFIFKKKKGEPIIPKKVEPPRPAHEIAFEELEALKNSDLLQEGKIKEYYIIISEIIRKYIEGRYFMIALEMTTSQLIENLKIANIDSEIIEMIQNFLDECDFVKFAKYIPSDEENQQILEKAYKIVDYTKIVIIKEEVPANNNLSK